MKLTIVKWLLRLLEVLVRSDKSGDITLAAVASKEMLENQHGMYVLCSLTQYLKEHKVVNPSKVTCFYTTSAIAPDGSLICLLKRVNNMEGVMLNMNVFMTGSNSLSLLKEEKK